MAPPPPDSYTLSLHDALPICLLFGIDRAEEGTILVEGRPAEIASPVEAILRGIGFCPEDRKLEGVIGDLSLREDRKSTRLNSSHDQISYAVFCLKKKKRD